MGLKISANSNNIQYVDYTVVEGSETQTATQTNFGSNSTSLVAFTIEFKGDRTGKGYTRDIKLENGAGGTITHPSGSGSTGHKINDVYYRIWTYEGVNWGYPSETANEYYYNAQTNVTHFRFCISGTQGVTPNTLRKIIFSVTSNSAVEDYSQSIIFDGAAVFKGGLIIEEL